MILTSTRLQALLLQASRGIGHVVLQSWNRSAEARIRLSVGLLYSLGISLDVAKVCVYIDPYPVIIVSSPTNNAFVPNTFNVTPPLGAFRPWDVCLRIMLTSLRRRIFIMQSSNPPRAAVGRSSSQPTPSPHTNPHHANNNTSTTSESTSTTPPTPIPLATDTITTKDGTTVRARIDPSLAVDNVIRQLCFSLRIQEPPAKLALMGRGGQACDGR